MSLNPAEHLHCNACEERLYFPSDYFFYWLSDDPEVPPSYRDWNWLPVLTQRIWCSACNRLSYAERIPSLREFEKALAVKRTEDQGDIGYLEDPLLELRAEDLQMLAQRLHNRTGGGACLLCGGHAYTPIQINDDCVINLRHRDCGGHFKHTMYYINALGPKTVHWFNLEGQIITTQRDNF